MAEDQSQYKSSTPQERFSRQLDRDVSRGRLSQSTIRALITNDTAQWAKSIYDQKLSQNNSSNFSLQQSAPSFATTQTSEEFPTSAIGGNMLVNDGYATAGSGNSSVPEEEEDEGGGGAGLPEGALGDLLYNNGTDWVVLSAPEESGSIMYWTGDAWQFIQPPETAEDQEKFFYWNGTDWIFSDVKVFDVCENGQAKQYRIPAIPEEE